MTCRVCEQMLNEVEESVGMQVKLNHIRILLEKSVFPVERVFDIFEVPEGKRQWYLDQVKDIPRPERNMVSWLDKQSD